MNSDSRHHVSATFCLKRAGAMLGVCIALQLGSQWVASQETLPESDRQSIARQARNYFAAHESNGDFSGQVVISHNGSIVFEDNFGQADVTKGTPVTSKSRFYIASVSKTLTSATLLMLEKEDKLSVTDRLSDYLGSFPNGSKMQLRNLLLFASGIDNPDYAALEKGPKLSSKSLLDHLAKQELLFLPGTYSQYGNGNYIVLGCVIEAVTGQPYSQVVRQKFLEPLQMNDTFESSSATEFPNVVAGHTPGPGESQMVPASPLRPDLLLGSGGIISTARDLNSWGGAVAKSQFIELSSLEYPYGWGRVRDHDTLGYEQTGAVSGFMSVLRVYPKEGWVIVVLANTEYGQWNDWGKEMAQLVFTGELNIPKQRPKPIPMTNEEISKLVGKYQNADSSCEIRARENNLWVFFNDSEEGKFMSRIGGTYKFAVRADWYSIDFENVDSGAAAKLTQSSPDGDVVFERAPTSNRNAK